MISDYTIFQAKLYPVLPFLFYQAGKVKMERPTPPAISEQLILGSGELKILVLGESTVAGVGASQPQFTLPGQLSKLMGHNYEITNLGKNGLRISQVFSHLGGEILDHKNGVKGIFIFLGANDCFHLTHPIRYRKHLNNVISKLLTQFTPDWIYLADIPPVHLFPAFPALLRNYLKTQRNFLRAEMIAFANENQNVVFDPLTGTFNPEFFSSDGIHPSDFGYEKIAEFAFNGLKNRFLI
ncbi:SGNH/GDSL hydrolase family protein [Algoriphagus lacus]|uniref:SGNH/GDSL hydrolase family protein n=1 Tax=Algoriphagus lacus TaxID=2056311 RepID=A0A418PSN1_9BACT|nr:SGNH/GDSL hydrolase family protein [Algoriphagus lacus]RIW15891.1 SGNH/GDSL hydrolase family protein [Algoriphagus lacus]